LRNAGQRDRGRERAIASLGKHYPFPHSKPDTESFAICFGNGVGNAIPVTIADIRISRFQPGSNGVGWFDARAGKFTRGIPNSSQQTEAVNASVRDAVEAVQHFAARSHSLLFFLIVRLGDQRSSHGRRIRARGGGRGRE